MKRKFLALGLLLVLGFSLFAYSISLPPLLKKRFVKIAEFITEHSNIFLMYQNLANPYVRHIYIPAGLRKEQIAMIYSKNLRWDQQDVEHFLKDTTNPASNLEGYYYPSTYTVSINADGESVRDKMLNKFDENVTSKIENKNSVLDKRVINMDTALKIASLIQREAAGKHDMNLISGIIWNRIWNGMSLDIDATLQYAKGSDQNGWWPQVSSKDKQINSPYNTYKNKGLPPSPIASPSLAAIEAAYNPTKTSCIFYLHDKNKRIHCSRTYEQHKNLVEQYLR
jgi:UPF0755 protein